MPDNEDPKTQRIRELNDQLRTTMNPAYGRILFTRGVAAFDSTTREILVDRVRTFNSFTENNDPYGEHDFGSVWLVDTRFFWKIDYYDKLTEYGSEDPSDPAKTTRVLTIMLAEEY